MLGNPVREDAKILGVSAPTVWRWRQRLLSHMRATEPDDIQVIDCMVMIEKRLMPARTMWASHPRGVHGNDTSTKASVAFTATQPASGEVRFAVIPHDAEIQEPVANLIDLSAEGQLFTLTGTWAFPISSEPEEPILMHSVLTDDRYRDINQAREAVLELQTLFFGWMRRFRGVATRYLRNYVGWFESALDKGDIDSPIWSRLRGLRWRRLKSAEPIAPNRGLLAREPAI